MATQGTHHGLRRDLEEVLSEARELRPRKALDDILDAFRENDLLTYVSAISFQVLFALIPVALFTVALLGALHLGDAWSNDLAPRVRAGVSPSVFAVLDDTVTRVLRSGQLFWMTFGAVLAVWKTSGAMRAVMGVLNKIYGTGEDERGILRRFAISAALALGVGLCLLGAIAVAGFGGGIVRGLVGDGVLLAVTTAVVRWTAAVALLLCAMALMVRFAPSHRRPWHWVSFGAVVVIAGWIVMTVCFYLYLSRVANYGSLFGNMATVFVVVEYLYLSALVFVTGLQLDALAQHQVSA